MRSPTTVRAYASSADGDSVAATSRSRAKARAAPVEIAQARAPASLQAPCDDRLEGRGGDGRHVRDGRRQIVEPLGQRPGEREQDRGVGFAARSRDVERAVEQRDAPGFAPIRKKRNAEAHEGARFVGRVAKRSLEDGARLRPEAPQSARPPRRAATRRTCHGRRGRAPRGARHPRGRPRTVRARGAPRPAPTSRRSIAAIARAPGRASARRPPRRAVARAASSNARAARAGARSPSPARSKLARAASVSPTCRSSSPATRPVPLPWPPLLASTSIASAASARAGTRASMSTIREATSAWRGARSRTSRYSVRADSRSPRTSASSPAARSVAISRQRRASSVGTAGSASASACKEPGPAVGGERLPPEPSVAGTLRPAPGRSARASAAAGRRRVKTAPVRSARRPSRASTQASAMAVAGAGARRRVLSPRRARGRRRRPARGRRTRRSGPVKADVERLAGHRAVVGVPGTPRRPSTSLDPPRSTRRARGCRRDPAAAAPATFRDHGADLERRSCRSPRRWRNRGHPPGDIDGKAHPRQGGRELDDAEAGEFAGSASSMPIPSRPMARRRARGARGRRALVGAGSPARSAIAGKLWGARSARGRRGRGPSLDAGSRPAGRRPRGRSTPVAAPVRPGPGEGRMRSGGHAPFSPAGPRQDIRVRGGREGSYQDVPERL